MPLVSAASLLIALSNASGPSRMPPLICPRSAILHSAAASSVACIFELTVSTAARIATFGFSKPERDGQIDRVLTDIDFVFQRRRDIDGGIGHDQNLVISRHVHDEDVADAASGAQSAIARDDRRQQFVSVQAALHQHFGAAFANECHCLGRRRVLFGSIDDLQVARDRCRLLWRSPPSCLQDRPGSERSISFGSLDRAGPGRRFAWISDCGGHRLETQAPFQQPFVFSSSCCVPLLHLLASLVSELSRTAGPVSFNSRVRTIAMPLRKVAAQSAPDSARVPFARRATGHARRIQPKTGPNSALKVKFRKLTTPVAVPPNCGGLASLITVYGSIAAPDASPATRPSTYGGKTSDFAVEDPGEAGEQHDRAADDHRFAPPDPI